MNKASIKIEYDKNEKVNGLGMMIGQYLEQNLEEFEDKVDQASKLNIITSVEVEKGISTTIKFHGNRIFIQNGVAKDTHLHLKSAYAVLAKVLSGTLNPAAGVLGGKIKIVKIPMTKPFQALRLLSFLKIPQELLIHGTESMTHNDINLGRGAFIYMLGITAGIILAGVVTACFIDTDAVMKSPDPGLLEAAMWIIMCLIIPFAVWHSAVRKGFKPAIIATVVTIFAAWLAEGVGVNYGWWFGAYHYTDLFNPKIWGVPLVICIAWEPILYGAYVVTDFIFPVDRDRTRSFTRKMVPIVLLSLIGASVTTILDLVADPDAVGRGWWIWHEGGPYFRDIAGGVPVKNYIGWFKLSFICHVVYRLAAEFGTVDRHSVYLDVYTPPLLYLQLYLFVLGFAWLYLKRADVVLISMGMGTVCFIALVKAVMYKMGYGRQAYRYLEDKAS